MAKRMCFLSTPHEPVIFKEVEIDFSYYNGFAISQKQKSILSMHDSILKLNSELKVLEISTKSTDSIGVALSAFNLKLYDEFTNQDYPLENIFQSSKVFENGGPYRDLLYVQPRDAKRDERIRDSGKLVKFHYMNKEWGLEPKTMFYDWIYMSALYSDKLLSKKILNYDAFTDIEFNQERSINCQARSAAIFVSLYKKGILEKALNNNEQLEKIYPKDAEDSKQISFFN